MVHGVLGREGQERDFRVDRYSGIACPFVQWREVVVTICISGSFLSPTSFYTVPLLLSTISSLPAHEFFPLFF